MLERNLLELREGNRRSDKCIRRGYREEEILLDQKGRIYLSTYRRGEEERDNEIKKREGDTMEGRRCKICRAAPPTLDRNKMEES